MLLGLSLRTIYEGVYAGWIPSRKIGNSRLIPASWLEASTDREAEHISSQIREAERISPQMGEASRNRPRNSPKNRYSLAKSPRDLRGFLRLVRNAFSHQLRTSRSQCIQRGKPPCSLRNSGVF